MTSQTTPKLHEGITTQLLHSGYDPSQHDGAIIPPLHLTTTFAFGNKHGYDYSRSGNPTRHVLERTLAALDNANFALAYSSGSAVLANILGLLNANEAVLFSSDAYGGTYRYVTQVFGKQGGQYRVVDLTDIEATEAALRDGAVRVVWVETPTNPLLKVSDIAALATAAHRHGALLVVDNTFATPVIQRPLDAGADIVVYSTTKYMNGHSDSIGGSLALRDEKLYQALQFLQNAIGAILSPFDSWLTLRGLRTLELRMKQHVQSAQQVAQLLTNSPKVKAVYYPGLFTGEQRRIVQQQMAMPGGMVSFELDDRYDAQTFLQALAYIPLAESLGGIESLIDHPASMTHAAIPQAERQKIGLSDGLLRLSVGIENTGDLLGDLRQALARTR